MEGPSALQTYSSISEYLDPRHCRICLQGVGDGPLDAYGLTPELVRHVQEVHGLLPAAYRHLVLTSIASAGLVEAHAQVLRSCSTAYRRRLSDASFKAGICACCAREERRSQLRHVTFPALDALPVPEWLEWSQECWQVPVLVLSHVCS